MNNFDTNSNLQKIYSNLTLDFKTFINNDPNIQREDTLKGLLVLLEQLKNILATVNNKTIEQRAKHYHIAYNAIIYITDIAETIKKSSYAFEAIPFLMESVVSMEGNIILQDVKFLDKRTQIYISLAQIYEEAEYYSQAISLLDTAIAKYKELKAIHEIDQPVPQHISAILEDNIKILKIMLIKYCMQGGVISPADWKKKVDEEFQQDNEAKLLCLTECLRTETRKHSNIFTKNLKGYKQSLVQVGYEFVKPHLEIIGKSLTQQKQKIQREVNFKNTMNLTQQLINQQIKKKREAQDKYIKQSDFKKASEAFPLEYHAQLIHYALQTKNYKILNQLADVAQIRIECRRIQVPYVNDVLIVVSNSPHPNIPNGYTKIPVDLNDANLKIELAKLRKSGKKAPEEQNVAKPSNVKEEKPVAAKDAKKGAKQVVAQVQKKQQNQQASQWQLKQIQHKYVFMMIRKSMSGQSALYDMKIVLGNEQKGPVGFNDTRRIIVPYIQQNMKVIESSVKQHTGVQQTSGMVPYIILYHSRNNLDSDIEKKTVITDVKPLIGTNPMIPAKWGYNKIDVDLRQVPEEFIKAPNHQYVYLQYKTDELFHISQRHIQIIKAFAELQATFNQRKSTSTEDDKYIEMDVTYDLQKLSNLFEVMQDCLKGELGQQYYLQRNDFLTHLTFELWSKYLKNALIQLDYMREQRLNNQIVDYDYNHYKQIQLRCGEIFLKGLKVLNLIMLNNANSDILLLSKINLELAKLLEEQRQYRIASDNLRLCLDRLRVFRDEYLSKGVDGRNDKILPFSISCSPKIIANTIEKMKISYNNQRRKLQKMKRIHNRQINKQRRLTNEQLQQQQKQLIRYRKKDEFDEVIDKISTKHSQLYSIVHAIELDLINIYFRISLKRTDELSKTQTNNQSINGIDRTELQGLAATEHKKLNMINGPTQTKNIKNVNQLQTTLVNANKLPPPKPALERTQKILIQQNQKNPYTFALLMLNLAALNSQNKDKKYFLQESLHYIQIAKEKQIKMCEKAIDNAIFILSGLWDSKTEKNIASEQIYPFQDLYTSLWNEPTENPDAPILVGKTSQAIYLKLPPFVPVKSSEKKAAKQVKYMSIYGKPSANGVDVSINCNELEGTAIKMDIGKTVKISSLKPNGLYCFAAAGVDQYEETMPIGKTGEDIGTFNALSIPMLACYLAKVSYQIDQYEIAEKAARIILNQYCIESHLMSNDDRINNLYYYLLDQKALAGASLMQIKSVAQSLYVLALCERRKLFQLRQNVKNQKAEIIYQDKQNLITNLMMLSGLLTPTISAPNMSIPFLIPDRNIVYKAFLINLIPQKWMNPKIRKLGSSVMIKILKWGLENNEISLARKIAYKWNERKFLILGKMIQVEEKKEVKKGKESKDQQVKMIDKYCRMMVQKSPHLMDAFEDSLLTINEDYYDYVAMFVERAKQQIAMMSQYVDNTSEQIDSINNHLNLKLELLEYLKDPVASIKKIGTTSPYYLEYNCKILKKALEITAQADFKNIVTKSQQLQIPDITQQIKTSKQIYEIMLASVKEDIAWNPSSKLQLINTQAKTGKDLSKAINIFEQYQNKKMKLTEQLRQSLALTNKFKDYDYLNIWISQLYHLKALSLICTYTYDFNVKKKVKVRYDKIRLMNLEDLFKKQQELAVLQDKPFAFTEDQIKKLNQVFNYISQSVYSAMVVQNWLKLQTLLSLTTNILTHLQLTPFNHQGTQIWTHFCMISLCIIEMLVRIRKEGFHEFKTRYNKKIANAEISNIQNKLQMGEYIGEPLIEQFVPIYYPPQLDDSTTKTYWFQSQKYLDIQTIAAVISYTVNTLRLENKHNLVVNVVRDFCNATQHYFSLQLLPFMANSQDKMLQEVETIIEQTKKQLLQAEQIYQQEKQKKGKKRAAMLSGQKLEFQIVFEAKSAKLSESLRLLEQQRQFIVEQKARSSRIKEEISRDTSKQVLRLREQRKYMAEFGQHYEQMREQFGEEAKHVRKSKNFIKDIINKYDAIYYDLMNSKTSKDPLAEIQNRNQVGNLCYAAGSLDKAFEYWNDSLATIFKKVHPVDHYHDILTENKPYLVINVGAKQILLSICLLYKLSNFTSTKKLNFQRSCAHFASHLVFALFQTNSNYPQTYLAFKDWRIKQLPFNDLLNDEETINISELARALQYFILQNLYDDNQTKTLPLVSFFQFIATDIVKNTQLSVRSKLLKSIALSESGLINESIGYLSKVAYEKDLPVLWLQYSDYLKKQKGMNWINQTIDFKNSEGIVQNKLAIEEIKKINIRNDFAVQFGLLNPILFNYAKALILYKIHEIQICKDQALNDIRLANLAEADGLMRESIKKLAINEEFYSLLQEYQANQFLFRQNQTEAELKKQMETSKAKMIDYLKKNGVDQTLIKVYEKQVSSAQKRSVRLQLICKIRYSLFKLNEARNLYSNCYYILKNGLFNIHRYAIGARNCQNGYDPEIKVNAPPPVANKKDEKKGAKKEEQVNNNIPVQSIDVSKDEQIKKNNENKTQRSSMGFFWHLKFMYQIGRVLFKQNNFKDCIHILQAVLNYCKIYEQEYFSLLSLGYINRAKIRLGTFDPQAFKLILQELDHHQFFDVNYVNFVMDYAEVESEKNESLDILKKGLNVAVKLWEQNGMKQVIGGIVDPFPPKSYYTKEEISAQQQQAIRKKKKGQKKGVGKDDKKGAKKDDGKKKKQESKIDYKVVPLSKYSQVNLLEEQKLIFGQYGLNPHPNYCKNNIYQTFSLLYIKCYLKFLEAEIYQQKREDFSIQMSYILKLIHVVESYTHSLDHFKITAYKVLAFINKKIFMNGLKGIISYKNKIKTPFEDLPLNSNLIEIPAYSQFIHQNRKYLVESRNWYKKCLNLIQNSTILFQGSLCPSEIAWECAENQRFLTEYIGRQKPKYLKEEQVKIKSQQIQLEKQNNLLQVSSFLELSIKVKSIMWQLKNNYLELGSKLLQANAKIDEDIVSQIMEIDKQCKKNYTKLLIEANKGKQQVSATDLITYMLKAFRQSELMTFSNPQYQNILYKCTRILAKSLPTYKQKCIISSTQVALKKSLQDKFIDNQMIVMKSIKRKDKQHFIYILGPIDKQQSVHGKVIINLNTLSQITENLYSLTFETVASDKKNESIKNRNYIYHKKRFRTILESYSRCFGIDPESKENENLNEVELNQDNLRTMIKMLEANGFSGKNGDINRYLRGLHKRKYML